MAVSVTLEWMHLSLLSTPEPDTSASLEPDPSASPEPMPTVSPAPSQTCDVEAPAYSLS